MTNNELPHSLEKVSKPIKFICIDDRIINIDHVACIYYEKDNNYTNICFNDDDYLAIEGNHINSICEILGDLVKVEKK
ncbi:MAG: hypothetical protein QNJ33_11845 [Crocosphaera sp.]|nr:hypothetical protein [Crocosphaera sp.]